jgi:hypothetical protein
MPLSAEIPAPLIAVSRPPDSSRRAMASIMTEFIVRLPGVLE